VWWPRLGGLTWGLREPASIFLFDPASVGQIPSDSRLVPETTARYEASGYQAARKAVDLARGERQC
jgi:hypothetical protein